MCVCLTDSASGFLCGFVSDQQDLVLGTIEKNRSSERHFRRPGKNCSFLSANEATELQTVMARCHSSFH